MMATMVMMEVAGAMMMAPAVMMMPGTEGIAIAMMMMVPAIVMMVLGLLHEATFAMNDDAGVWTERGSVGRTGQG
ncbi:hypothetical protein OCOJLMKI_1702 [Methylobacterium iners]|uniref:Uncharacterized protein n=2 Tax=Methylobacterium iners TaxID=418707 RepID=A0ABQ4RYA6_9HYPH|nr:hypothetical protein OCOJLMKI_1702 [Methylobacterium iners]